MDNKKYRNICVLLYPEEQDDHLFALEYIKAHYDCAYINHNRDCDDDGNLKKAHTHCVLKFHNGRYCSAIAKELDIEPRFVVGSDNLKSSLRYLVHAGVAEKFQYDISDVGGSLVPELTNLLEVRNEGERVLTLLSLLDSLPRPTSYRAFLVACCKNNLYGEFRRLGIGATKLLDEHNMEFY